MYRCAIIAAVSKITSAFLQKKKKPIQILKVTYLIRSDSN